MKLGLLKRCAALSALLATTACVHPAGPAATEADNLDGRTFSSKPGMARLYVIQGLEKMADRPGSGSGSTVIASGPAGSPMVAGAAAGLLIANLVKAAQDKPEPQAPPVIPPDPADPANQYAHFPIPIPNDVFLNGTKLGTIGHLQYFAVDLPPAEYEVTLTAATTWKQPFSTMKVTLKAGDVTFLLTSELAYSSDRKNERALLDCKPADCQPYVLASRRVTADWK